MSRMTAAPNGARNEVQMTKTCRLKDIIELASISVRVRCSLTETQLESNITMKKLSQSLATITALAFGYVLGVAHSSSTQLVQAQGGADGAPSQEAVKAVTDVYAAVQNAKTVLSGEGRYNLATKTLNLSALGSGGVDAIADLEAGRGVDPETFAALYADQATDEIAADIGKDEQGRLTYKGKVVRMYSVSKLKQMFQERLRYSGEDTKKK